MKKKLVRWTESDIQTLRDYCHEGIDTLCKKFPSRSVQSIRTKCCYLDLSIGEPCIITEKVYMVV